MEEVDVKLRGKLVKTAQQRTVVSY